MALLHFHSHHPLSCKEGIIYSQALWYNVITSKDHILQEELMYLFLLFVACQKINYINAVTIKPEVEILLLSTRFTLKLFTKTL